MRFFRIYIIFILSLSLFSQSTQKYWVLWADKNPSIPIQLSDKCLENRKILGLDTLQNTDIPVNPQYVLALQQLHILPLYTSKWLNATSAYIRNDQIHIVQSLPFVKELIPITCIITPAHTEVTQFLRGKKRRKKGAEVPEPSEALKSINYSYLEKNGYTGSEVVVGITDAGYTNLDKQDYFKKAMAEHRVLGTRDFLVPGRGIGIFENLTGKDTHGREVSKCIAGRSDKEQFGVAFDAKFYLARTENAKEERRQEEDAWVAAIEWFDSLGVRLVNSSLGYGKGFDNPSESYGNDQMNGYTTLIAKAALIATTQKEMIIVNSAGNSGSDKEWKGYVSSPADVPTVLSIGATDAYSGKMGYSSIGPEYNGYIKPDVSAFSRNGTSFSAPLVTGIVACILQKHNKWCNDQIKNALYESSSLFPYKNNFIGYGVPNCQRLVEVLDGETLDDSTTMVYAQDSIYKIEAMEEILKLNTEKSKIITFRTQAPGFVLYSESLDANKETYTFKRLTNEDYCLLLTGCRKYIIIWPQTFIEE